MKHELLKKTLTYRLLAFIVGLIMTTILTLFLLLIRDLNTLTISLIVAVIVEINSIGIYYIFEYFWRKYINNRLLKEGTSVLSISGDPRVRIAYEVIEDLGEGRLIIEVI